MSGDQTRAEVIKYWMEKAREALDSARSEHLSGRLVFAVNRAYYACFYAASAVLLFKGERFRKHSGVRAGVHRLLIKGGKLDASYGRFYDLIFDSRQRGDYQELVEFTSEQSNELISKAEDFVKCMQMLLQDRPCN